MEMGQQKLFGRREVLLGLATTAAGAALFSTGCTSSTEAESNSTSDASLAGYGSAQARNGVINACVIVKDGVIENIDLISHSESTGIGDVACASLITEIIENQTLNVDTVTGATLASMGLVSAIKQGLDAVGEDADEWASREASTRARNVEIPNEADVVVLGSGGAGLSAAITAAENGKTVVVLEQNEIIGGNSVVSGAGYAVPNNYYQELAGIEDSPELMASDMYIGGDELGDMDLINTLCHNAKDSWEWLTNKCTINWKDLNIQDGGHSVARTGQPVGNGAGVITKMSPIASGKGIVVASRIKATEITVDADGHVSGVIAEDLIDGSQVTINSQNVVIATGGFGQNVDMRVKYNAEYDDEYMCTNIVGANGDGIVMAENIGAALVGMEYIQTHPQCSPVDGSMALVGGSRTTGKSIMVNIEGKRFVEELERRDVVSQAMLAQTGGMNWYLTAKKDLATQYTSAPETIEKLIAANAWSEGVTLEEACEPLGIDAAELQNTLDTWNTDAETGVDSQFGYSGTMYPIEADETGYVLNGVITSVHYTMGGIAIDTEARVLDTNGDAIPGLFAAGETTGGTMGSNRLGTTSFPDVIIFGRIAGQSASA